MTVHLTNLRGKVFKSGAMQRVFLKVMVMTISNQQVNQTTLLNLDSAVSGGYNLVFGIGFALESAIKEVAPNNPDTHYVIVDSVVADEDNVVSVGFADHEASYLAGVACCEIN